MRDTDKAYLAGIIDGEGCIAIVHGRQLILKIAMSDLPVLEYIASLLDCNISKGKRFNQLQVSGYKVKWILSEIMPYLIGKSDQAALALRFPLGVQHHKYSLSAVDYQIRGDVDMQLKSLKVRRT